MENKKSFGTFICQRRKELGMTQKEFAQRLFVTDSAVSKWERGVVCFKRLIHHDMSKSLKTYKATKQKGDPHEQTEDNRPV